MILVDRLDTNGNCANNERLCLATKQRRDGANVRFKGLCRASTPFDPENLGSAPVTAPDRVQVKSAFVLEVHPERKSFPKIGSAQEAVSCGYGMRRR